MILVRHAMSSDLKTAKPDMTAADAAGLMRNYDVGVIPVVEDDGTLVGLVTDRDLVVRVIADREDPNQVRLRDIATKSVVTVTPDMSISDARDLMAEHKVRRLPVMKDGRIVGIISLGDVALADASKRAVGDTLEDVSESPSTTDVEANAPERGTPERVQENWEQSA
ncbi:MAG: CBS domain-containing protein [Actinomycetota bacterium]